MQIRNDFATILIEKMNKQKITPAKLSKLIDVADTSVHRYIKGTAKPRKLLLERIARVLHCSIDEFYTK